MKMRWVVAAGLALFVQRLEAMACTTLPYADDGKYIGGDLVEQIAKKAHTIQIMKATERHLMIRTYETGKAFLYGGVTPPLNGRPEYQDQFAYAFEVLETIKGGKEEAEQHYEERPRIVAYGAREMLSPRETGEPPPYAVPEDAFEKPAKNGFVLLDHPQSGAIADGAACSEAYFIDIGDEFIAFRNYRGELVDYEGWGFVKIDAELRDDVTKKRERRSISLQSLVPLESNSKLLEKLRAAVAAVPEKKR